MLISILMFGLPFAMLDLNRPEEEKLINDTYGWWFLDSVFNEAFASIGVPYSQNYDGEY